MEKIMPRKINNGTELRSLYGGLIRDPEGYDKADIEAINYGLLESTYDLMDRGGKRWRPVLGMAMAECFGREVSEELETGKMDKCKDVMFVCAVTEMVHNASLILDDVEDKSLKRRG